MKKTIYTTALMLMAAMVLTSCGDKLKNKETKPVERQVSVVYTINSSPDLIDAIDLVVTYKGKGGINVSDTISDTVWTKTVVNDMIPVKIGLDWSLSPKTSSKISKDSLDLYASYSIVCKEVHDTLNHPQTLLSWKEFPASKLQQMCDLENHKQAYARSQINYISPCYTISPDSNGNGLKYDYSDWDD